MAISEFEIKRCEREVEKFLKARRPPAHIRNQLDFGYRLENQSVELYEIRPDWKRPRHAWSDRTIVVYSTTEGADPSCWRRTTRAP